MITRRQLVSGIAAAAAGAGITPRLSRAWGERTNGSAIKLGAQTNAWAIDPKRFDTFLGVLDQIRSIGYDGFETGFLNLAQQFGSPEQARASIANTGLTFFGIHIYLPQNRIDPATKLPPSSLYEGVARGGAALGAQRLIFSGWPATTADELKRKVEGLHTAGAFSKSAGLGFAYHNHWFEFQSKVDEMEALYRETDPALVSFLLDAGHAYRGGADPPAFLRKHYQRIVGLHLRDYHDGKQVPLGEGSFPLAEVAATLKQLHWSGWVLNEEEREDGTKLGRSVMEPSFAALKRAFPQ
jgi:sugar phosphate isomerase/epimerase